MYTLANPSYLLALSVILSIVQAHVPRQRPASSPLVCHEDRQLQTLRRFSDYADDFCPAFLASIGRQPRWLDRWNKGKVSSACACYERTTTANGAPSTIPSTPTVTGTAFLASSTAPAPFSEVFATTSATGGIFPSMSISEGDLQTATVSGSTGLPAPYPSGSGASSSPLASDTSPSTAPFPFGSGVSSEPYASGTGASSAPYPSGSDASLVPYASRTGASSALYPSGSGASSVPYASGTSASSAPYPSGSGASSVPYTIGTGASSAPYPTGSGASSVPYASGTGASSAPYPSGSGISSIPYASGSGVSSRFMTGSSFGTAPVRTGRCYPSSGTAVYASGTGQPTYPSGTGNPYPIFPSGMSIIPLGTGITYSPYPSGTGQPVTSGTGNAYSSGSVIASNGLSFVSSHSMSLASSGSEAPLPSATAANSTIPPYSIASVSTSQASLADAVSSIIPSSSDAAISTSQGLLTAAASSIVLSSSIAPDSTSQAPSAAAPSQTSEPTRNVTAGNNYPPQPPGGGPGKRGLCYDENTEAGWSDLFGGSRFATYGSNGDVIRGTQFTPSRLSFVPTLKVDANLNNDEWDLTVPLLIEGSTKALFASNEPDSPDGANLTPEQAATVYKRYMMPYAGRVQLGTPAITNGDSGTTGLAYLEEFLTHCDTCVFNFINIHHHLPRTSTDPNQYAALLKEYIDVTVPAVQARNPQIKGLPIFIGGWWLRDASLDEGSELMSLLLPYLDGNPRVLAYQATGGLWKGSFVLEDGSGLTLAGKKYATWMAASPTGTLVDEKDLN